MKKVKFKLVGQDGNALSLIGGWSRAARQQGWTSEEIKAVTSKAMDGDYNNVLATLTANCEGGGF